MKVWQNIKKRLRKAGHMKEIKKKAVTRHELVGAGALLTGGSVMMECLTKDTSPQISGQDIVYNSDSSPAIIKFESLSKGQHKMTTLETLGWVIFGLFLILFTIPVIKVIKKILRICNRKTNKYSLEDKSAEEPVSEGRVNFKHHVHDRLEDKSKPQDMEKVWVQINQHDSDSSPELINIQDESTRNKMETTCQGIASRQGELESIQDGQAGLPIGLLQ